MERLRTAEEVVIEAVRRLQAEVKSAIEPGGGFDHVADDGKLTLDVVRRIVRELVIIDGLCHAIPERWTEPPKTREELSARRQATDEAQQLFDPPDGWFAGLLRILSKAAELEPPPVSDESACASWHFNRSEISNAIILLEQHLDRRSRSMIRKHVLRRPGDAGNPR